MSCVWLGLLRAIVLAVPSVLSLGCASAPPSGSPSRPGASRATTLPSLEMDQDPTPPDGSKRLTPSLDCEPEPPCTGCVIVKGEKARHVGSLDKEVIRAIIRNHVPEVKICYDAVATTHPDAAGKIMVRFGISASGRVATSCLVNSELRDQYVERCVVDLPLSWRFPQPDGGGWVVVSYPFVFTR